MEVGSKKGRVLVAMPCYKAMSTVLMAIKSVAEQTYKNYLLVCCDDSSPDNTYEVLKNNQNEFGYELIQNQDNLGTGDTVNKIFEIYDNGDFEFMTWISADNVLGPEFLSKHVEKLNEGHAITYCGWASFAKNVNELIITLVPDRNLLHLKKLFVLGPGFLFRKKLWDRVKPFDKLPGEDYYFAVKCALVNAKFGYIDDTLVRYKDHDNSVSGRLRSGELKGQCSGDARLMAENINAVNGEDAYLL